MKIDASLAMKKLNASVAGSDRLSRILIPTAGAIFVSIVASGVWDVVAKPGLNWLSSTMFDLLGLLSVTVENLPYSTAALNPYSLPSVLILYIGIWSIPAVVLPPLVAAFMKPAIDAKIGRRFDLLESSTMRLVESYKLKITRRLTIFLTIYLTFLIVLTLTAFSIVNRAIAIRRIHEANIEILTPYLSSAERLQLQAQFAAMTVRADHMALHSQLKAIAATHRVRLRPEEVR